MPALGHQDGDRARKVARRDPERGSGLVADMKRALAEADLFQAERRLALRVGVAPEKAAALRVEGPAAFVVGTHDRAVVVERQGRAKAGGPPVGGRRPDSEPRTRSDRDLVVAQLLGQIQARQARQAEERRDEGRSLRLRHPKRPVLPEMRDPGEAAAVLEPRDALCREDEATGEQELGRGQGHALLAAAQ